MIATQHPSVAAAVAGEREPEIVSQAREQHRLLGSREFYVSHLGLLRVLRYALGHTPRPMLSLNRLHLDRRMIHRVEFMGLVFVCVSEHEVRLA
jgi:hypothetical protein